MAEICLNSSEACGPIAMPARRRRMEISRFEFVAGAETMVDELRRKIKKQEEEVVEVKKVAEKLTGLDPSSDSSGPHRTSSSSSIDSETSDQWPRFGSTSVCGRRRDMEDTVSIRSDFIRFGPSFSKKHHFFGVFDGHGCSHVAALCRDIMHEIIAAEAEEEESSVSSSQWEEVMKRSFEEMDAEAVESPGGGGSCRCELQTRNSCHVGSTAIVAVVSADRTVVANCGDSRAVLCRRGAAFPLSVDQKPDRPDELERIEAAGGRVIYWDGPRVLGVLAMSRAIGDSYLKPYVISEPEVTVTERSDDDEFLILASDGLWDVVSNEMACNVVRMCMRTSSSTNRDEGWSGRGADKVCLDASLLLTKLALARRSSDNVSVVVVDLRRDY